jgi:hypothetical protein
MSDILPSVSIKFGEPELMQGEDSDKLKSHKL